MAPSASSLYASRLQFIRRHYPHLTVQLQARAHSSDHGGADVVLEVVWRGVQAAVVTVVALYDSPPEMYFGRLRL